MRLFIAVNFSEEVKQKLAGIQNGLKENVLRGNFTAYDNLHLTLVFLGEVAGSRISAAREAVNDVAVSPFELQIRGIGRFRRDGGDILWAGIDADQNLIGLFRRLSKRISSAGFATEERTFKPHLTLVRGAVLRDGFDRAAFSRTAGAIHAEVSKISLMKSERINGRLIYTELK